MKMLPKVHTVVVTHMCSC